MSRVSLEMKYHTGERLNVVGLRLAVLQCTIPYCSFSIAKWVFIAYSRRPYLVPNSQQESNNKFFLASNLDNPNHWLYDAQKLKLRSCFFNRPNLLFAQIGNMLRVLKLLNPCHLGWSAALDVNRSGMQMTHVITIAPFCNTHFDRTWPSVTGAPCVCSSWARIVGRTSFSGPSGIRARGVAPP